MPPKTDKNGYLPPEWRSSILSEDLVELSKEGFPLEPLEEDDKSLETTAIQSLNVLRDFFSHPRFQEKNILLFEPTRPDLRAAIVRSGARYVDAGRYLTGEPNIEAAHCALKKGIALTIFNYDDPVPESWPTPVLIDERGRPFMEEDRSADWHLFHLGTRDGLPENNLSWLSEKNDAMKKLPLSRDFNLRAQARRINQEKRLESMSGHAKSLGFETQNQAGFLWLALPGLSSEELRHLFAQNGVSVLGCDHHPYRQRVRLGPTNVQSHKKLFGCLESIAETQKDQS